MIEGMPSPPESREAFSRAATAWVSRLASGKATAAEVSELEEWLAADTRHRRAFQEARALWVGLAPLERPLRSVFPRRRLPAVPVAAALAACLVLAVLAPRLVSHDLRAPIGEVSEQLLADGTRIWLDSGAAADFDESAGSRTLRLVRGRVHVVVAKNERKPFQVEANGAVIRDIGTAFTVDTDGTALRVAVAEGLVEVHSGGTKTQLPAGHVAAFSSGREQDQKTFVVAAEAAWRDGHILLDETSLRDTLREIERYQHGRIVLLDAQAGQRRVSGSLSIHDLDAGLDSLANGQGLRVLRLPLLTIVTSRK